MLLNSLSFVNLAALLCLGYNAFAGPPPLRDQVSLNGTWDITPEAGSKTTITVPHYDWNA